MSSEQWRWWFRTTLFGWPRPEAWDERVGNWAWFMEHLADVRSDMSRFHRIDDLESMRADRFMEYAPRLVAYDGVVANHVRREATGEVVEPSALPVAQMAANPSPQDLMALNNTALYGPLQGEEVGLFNVRIIGGEDG